MDRSRLSKSTRLDQAARPKWTVLQLITCRTGFATLFSWRLSLFDILRFQYPRAELIRQMLLSETSLSRVVFLSQLKRWGRCVDKRSRKSNSFIKQLVASFHSFRGLLVVVFCGHINPPWQVHTVACLCRSSALPSDSNIVVPLYFLWRQHLWVDRYFVNSSGEKAIGCRTAGGESQRGIATPGNDRPASLVEVERAR